MAGEQALVALLAEAWERRQALHDDPETTAYRVFHGHGDGRPGLVVERFADTFVARCGRGPGWDLEPQELDALGSFLDDAHGPAARLVLRRSRMEPVVVAGGVSSEGEAVEHGLVFGIEPLTRRNPGLYLDARPARAWVRAHAEGRRLLNLFAWTGGFGVAGMAGGARSVIHVDDQKRALQRAAANHRTNAQRVDDRDLVCGDVYAMLRRAAKQGRRFGGVVIDAPPDVPRRGAEGQDYERLVPLARAVLADDGWILCTFSRRDRTRAAYEASILAACPDLAVLDRGESGEDFPESDPEHKLRFTTFGARHDITD